MNPHSNWDYSAFSPFYWPSLKSVFQEVKKSFLHHICHLGGRKQALEPICQFTWVLYSLVHFPSCSSALHSVLCRPALYFLLLLQWVVTSVYFHHPLLIGTAVVLVLNGVVGGMLSETPEWHRQSKAAASEPECSSIILSAVDLFSQQPCWHEITVY